MKSVTKIYSILKWKFKKKFNLYIHLKNNKKTINESISIAKSVGCNHIHMIKLNNVDITGIPAYYFKCKYKGNPLFLKFSKRMKNEHNVYSLEKVQNSPFFPKYYFYLDGKLPILGIEFLNNHFKPVFCYYNKKNRFSVTSISAQFLELLLFLINNNICHNDIQPSNVLISKNGTIKIIDFTYSVVYAGYDSKYIKKDANNILNILKSLFSFSLLSKCKEYRVIESYT